VDEARLIAVQTHFPGEVEGVDGDAVSADPRARVEGKKAERLGGGGVDDLADVHLQPAAHERELVGQRDVDVAEDVLVELGQLGHPGARYFGDGARRSGGRAAPRGACTRASRPRRSLECSDLERAVGRIESARRKGEKQFTPTRAPRASNIGSNNSSVVPDTTWIRGRRADRAGSGRRPARPRPPRTRCRDPWIFEAASGTQM